MPSNHLILWYSLLLLPSAFPRSGSFPTLEKREGICLQTRPHHTARFTPSDPFSSFMHEKTACVSLALTILLHSFYHRHVFYTFGLLASPPPTCSSPGRVWPGRVCVGGSWPWLREEGPGEPGTQPVLSRSFCTKETPLPCRGGRAHGQTDTGGWPWRVFSTVSAVLMWGVQVCVTLTLNPRSLCCPILVTAGH